MPDERDIEKALHARARRRREEAGAPLEMHPATRRLLQAEAARLRPGRQRGPIARWLWGSPLRLVLNLSAVVALVIAAVLVLPQLHPPPGAISAGREVLAENNRKQNENPMNGTLDELVQTDKDLRDAAKFKSNATAITLGDTFTVARKETAATSAMPGSAPPTPMFDNGAQAKNSPAIEAAAPAVTTAPAAAPATAAADMEAIPAPPVVQKLLWVNSPTNVAAHDLQAAKRPAITPLLGSFRTEQTGNRLRVIDADGSIYTGTIAAAARRQASSNGLIAPGQTQSFRVSGTNVTAHQRVVFTGRLALGFQPQSTALTAVAGGNVTVNNDVGTGAGGGGFGGAGRSAGATQTNAPATGGTVFQSGVSSGAISPQPQFRLEGTIRIGTNQIPVNAVPAAP